MKKSLMILYLLSIVSMSHKIKFSSSKYAKNQLQQDFHKIIRFLDKAMVTAFILIQA